MRRLTTIALAAFALAAAPVHAATVEETPDGTLRVAAAQGEANRLTVGPTADGAWLVAADGGAPLTAAGTGCAATDPPGAVLCAAGGVRRILVLAGDGDDEVTVAGSRPAHVEGGRGDDALATAEGADTVWGGRGSDRLATGDGRDDLTGGPGADTLDAGGGRDRLRTRDRSSDTASCGAGRDLADADVTDVLDPCEAVDYGPAGLVGPVTVRTGGGRFVRIPGQPGEWIDRRVLPDVLYLVRRYHVRVTDGYSLSAVHTARGEHPLGLAVDLEPGPGGTWDEVDRLARWAEPRQNHPRWPFRWVGYDGDYNHGRGNHLHLSWMHSTGTYGKPTRSVWVFGIGRPAASAAGLLPPPARYVAPAPDRR